MNGYESVSTIDIAADPSDVWAALTNNDSFGEAMFGTQVVTDWEIGGPIVYKGEFEGKSFEDKGTVVELTRPSRIRMTHYSPSSGDDDKPENYHAALLRHHAGWCEYPRDADAGQQQDRSGGGAFEAQLGRHVAEAQEGRGGLIPSNSRRELLPRASSGPRSSSEREADSSARVTPATLPPPIFETWQHPPP